MICMNCNVSIPSSFKHAISNNVCPQCGQPIMAQERMQAFFALKKDLGTIEMSLDKEQTIERIVMFLLDNYSVRPIVYVKQDGQKNKKIKRIGSSSSADDLEEEYSSEEDLKQEVYDEVEGELYGKGESDENGEPVVYDTGEASDDRVGRLKKKMESGKKFINKTGTQVNRVG